MEEFLALCDAGKLPPVCEEILQEKNALAELFRARQQRPQIAMELVAEMRQCRLKPNVFTRSAAISSCEKRAATAEGSGVHFRDEFVHAWAEREHVQCCRVSAFEKGQRPQKEKELISGKRQCLLEPDVITYSAAISDYGRRQRLPKALEFVAEMRQCRLKPNVFTCSAAISSCEKRAGTAEGSGAYCRDESVHARAQRDHMQCCRQWF